MLGERRAGGGLEQLVEVGGGHEGPSYGLRWSGPESVSGRLDALGCPLLVIAHGALFYMRPRSSGDRASASGAEGRRFESCRGHPVVFAGQRLFSGPGST